MSITKNDLADTYPSRSWPACKTGACMQGRHECPTRQACQVVLDDASDAGDQFAAARGIVWWCSVGAAVLSPIAYIIWRYLL